MRVWFDGESIDRRYPGDRFLRVVREPYSIFWEDDFGVQSLEVPARFITDLASVPRLLWSIIPPWDNFIRDAAICHDRAYESNQISRALADSLLYYGMLRLGASHVHAYMVWLGVRLGGRSSYRSGKERQAQRVAKLHELEEKEQ